LHLKLAYEESFAIWGGGYLRPSGADPDVGILKKQSLSTAVRQQTYMQKHYPNQVHTYICSGNECQVHKWQSFFKKRLDSRRGTAREGRENKRKPEDPRSAPPIKKFEKIGPNPNTRKHKRFCMRYLSAKKL
jgi:hypothetical protein